MQGRSWFFFFFFFFHAFVTRFFIRIFFFFFAGREQTWYEVYYSINSTTPPPPLSPPLILLCATVCCRRWFGFVANFHFCLVRYMLSMVRRRFGAHAALQVVIMKEFYFCVCDLFAGSMCYKCSYDWRVCFFFFFCRVMGSTSVPLAFDLNRVKNSSRVPGMMKRKGLVIDWWEKNHICFRCGCANNLHVILFRENNTAFSSLSFLLCFFLGTLIFHVSCCVELSERKKDKAHANLLRASSLFSKRLIVLLTVSRYEYSYEKRKRLLVVGGSLFFSWMDSLKLCNK